MVTLVSHSYDLFQLVLLVDRAYTIVNVIQVLIKKLEQLSKSLFCSSWLSSEKVANGGVQYLSFQIDSPLQLNTYNISQPLFTCSNS